MSDDINFVLVEFLPLNILMKRSWKTDKKHSNQIIYYYFFFVSKVHLLPSFYFIIHPLNANLCVSFLLLFFCFCFPLLFFLFYFIFKLYNIVLVLPNVKMNPPQVYPRSPSWTLLPPPSPTLPLGRPSAPAPSIQYHASKKAGWD